MRNLATSCGQIAEAEAESASEILRQPVAEFGSHNLVQAPAKLNEANRLNFCDSLSQKFRGGITCLILNKLTDPAARLYYLRATAHFGWSRNVLLNQIKAGAYERAVTEKKTHNFPLALPEYLAEQADEMLKSSYNLEFLGIRREVKERELEDRLISRLQAFLLELGYGFCFVGRQHRLAAGPEGVFHRSAFLPPLPQGAGGLRTESRAVRAGIRGQDGFLPEPAQRQGTRPR